MNAQLASEIADYLAARGIGTVGTDIFIGTFPETITSGMYIVDAPSPPPHQYLDTENVVLDFWYRHPKTKLAYEKLRAVYNLLHRKENWQTENFHIYFSEALGQIRDNDRDREGGKLYSISLQFIVRNINTVS